MKKNRKRIHFHGMRSVLQATDRIIREKLYILTPKDECMIKGILKYSLLSLLASVMEWMFLPEIDSLSNISNDHTLISLLSILPVIITAIGTFLFYRKNKDDDKRIMRSSLFFIATLILTGVLLLITIVLVFSIQNKK